LDSANLSPEARADLEISIAREMSSRHAAEQCAEFVEQRGLEKGKKEGKIETLRNTIQLILVQYPDWTDQHISDLLQVPIDLVEDVRRNGA
jgi:hypothetical protein